MPFSPHIVPPSLSQSLSPLCLNFPDPRLRWPQRHRPKPTQAPSPRSTPSPNPPSQCSPNADKPRFLWISWVSSLKPSLPSSVHCFGFPPIRPIRLRLTSLPPIRPTPTLSSSPKPSSAIDFSKSPVISSSNLLQEIDIEKLKKLKETFQGMEDHGIHISMAVHLYEAVENDNVDGFNSNLEQVEQVTASGNSVLHKAASFGSKNIAMLIIDKFPFFLTRRNVLGDTALHVAIKSRKFDVMKVLTGANVNDREQLLEMKNNVGNTALHEAVIAQCVDAVEYLFLQHKKVSYSLNDGGESPLCLAIETKNIKILELLLDTPYENCGLIERPRKESPVHAAIFMERRDMLEIIFEKNKQLFNIRDEKGKTPLHYAASKGYIDGVRFLLKNFQQQAFERSKNGDFPIHAACKGGHTKVVKEFLQQQWLYPTELLNKKSQNILHVAAENGQNNVVEAILSDSKLKELRNAVDENGNTALHLASLHLHTKVLCSLTWKKRVDLKRRNKEGLTALDIASSIRNNLKFRQDLTLWVLSSADTPYSEKGKKISLKGEREPPKLEQIQNLINVILVIAVLVATVTFSAALTVPAGLNRSDAGHRMAYQVFIICDSIAMYLSMAVAFLIIWALIASDMEKFTINYALILLIVAIFTMSMAFMAVVYAMSNIPWISYSLLAAGIYSLLTYSFILTSLIFPKIRNSNPIVHFISHYSVPLMLLFVKIWERVPLMFNRCFYSSNVGNKQMIAKQESQPEREGLQEEGHIRED